MRHSDWACYLYGLSPAGCDLRVSATGVDGRQPALLHVCGETVAVYSKVEVGEFVGETAEEHLQDLTWLGPKACRHEAVIEQAMSRAPVLPARFATLFTSLDSLDRFLLEHQEAIAQFFAKLGDQQEWSVKGLLDRANALERSSHGAADELLSSPGTRYFHQQQRKAQFERDFNRQLRTFCKRVAATLAANAGGFRERKVVISGSDRQETEIILNWAFLVSPTAIEEFRASLERFNAGDEFPGLMLRLSGPWPPYSFAPTLCCGAEV